MSVSNPVVATWSGTERRIYLLQGVDTFHWIEDIYREYRYWRRTDESSRKWLPFMVADGNDYKGGGKYTPRYVTLLDGVRVVPYDENILITVEGEAITDNADIDPDPFDTSGRTQPLKLYITPPSSELVRAEAEIAAVNRMSFDNAVSIDEVNGYVGTTNPLYGNREYPLKYLDDAITVAERNSLSTFYIIGDLTIGSSHNVSRYTLKGEGASFNTARTTITMISGCSTADTIFEHARIEGRQGGEAHYTNCVIGAITNSHCQYNLCGLDNSVQLVNSGWTVGHTTTLKDCYTESAWFVVDYNSSPISQVYSNQSGKLKFINVTNSSANITLQLDAAEVWLDSSCTAGTVTIRGVGTLINESSGMTVVTDGLINKTTISEAVLNTSLVGFDVESSVAEAMRFAAYGAQVSFDMHNTNSGTIYPIGTIAKPVNNMEDAVTIAGALGFDTIHLNCNHTFDATTNISGINFVGHGAQETSLTVVSGSILYQCSLNEAYITGTFFGVNEFNNCVISDLHASAAASVSGTLVARGCSFKNTISAAHNLSGEFILYDCYGLPRDDDGSPPIIDMQGSNATLQIRNYAGLLKLANITQETDVRMFLNSGGLELLPSVTNGNFTVAGVGTFTDGSTGWDSLNVDALMNSETIWEVAASEIYLDVNNGTDSTEYPTGTPNQPAKTLTNALAICAEHNISTIMLAGTLTLDQDISGKEIISWKNGKVDLNNQPCLATRFRECKVWGTQGSLAMFFNCRIDNITNMNGIFEDCKFLTTTPSVIANGAVIMMNNCRSQVPGSSSPVFDFSNGNIGFNNRAYSGGIRLLNSTDAGNIATIEFIAGKFNFDNSNTAGNFHVRGVCDLTNIDSSGGATVVTNGAVSSLHSAEHVWDSFTTDHTTSGTFGTAVTSSQDLTDITNKVDAIYNKLPAGTIASGGEYTADLTIIKDNVERALGLVQENYYIDQTSYITYNGIKLMTSGRMRIYSSAGSVGTANDVIATYTITTDWTNDEMTSYKVVKL